MIDDDVEVIVIGVLVLAKRYIETVEASRI
jgi:hypothetical protein